MTKIETIVAGQHFNYEDIASEDTMPGKLELTGDMVLVFNINGFVAAREEEGEYLALDDAYIYGASNTDADSTIVRKLAEEREYNDTVDIHEMEIGDWFVDSQIKGMDNVDDATSLQIIGDHIYVATNYKDTIVVASDMGNGNGLVFKVLTAKELLADEPMDEVKEAMRFHDAACLYDQVGELKGADQCHIDQIIKLAGNAEWTAMISLYAEDGFSGADALVEDVFGITMPKLNELADEFGYAQVA